MSAADLATVTAERDHLRTLLYTLRPLLPKAIDAETAGQRYALEVTDALLAEWAPPRPDALEKKFQLWDVVANRFGPASTEGFPFKVGVCQYADAIVAQLSPVVLVSRDGLTRWENLRPEDLHALVVVRPASNLEAGPAFVHMKNLRAGRT